jgi:hypothetical protein
MSLTDFTDEEKLIFGPMEIELARKVLVLRSARMWQVEKAVAALREKATGARVHVLSQPSAMDACGGIPGADAVIPFPGEKFSAAKLTFELLLRLRREKYDLVVVVLNNFVDVGYQKVYRLVSLTGVRRRLMYYPFQEKWHIIPRVRNGVSTILMAPFVAVAAAVAVLFHHCRGLVKTIAGFVAGGKKGGTTAC